MHQGAAPWILYSARLMERSSVKTPTVVAMAQCKTALIIDNDQDVLDSMKFWLSGEGCPCLMYKTAEAFLESEVPDKGFLIIDQMLPGMKGIDLLRLLRSRGVLLPAIVITTHPSAILLAEARRLDGVVVEKPLSEKFHTTIARLLT